MNLLVLRNLTVTLLFAAVMSPVASAQRESYGGPPINYLTAEVNDRVAVLAKQLEAGEAELEYDEQHGYLQSLLSALDVPVSSQTLVFSKTSLQLHRISPRRPRALYFNDDVYVGWCQNGEVLEIAATDAQQGVTFYSLKQTPEAKPRFIRDQGQCLSCHSSSRTQNVPGYVIRSVYPDAAGRPVLGSGTFTTDHTSPLKERWGGWYVTGEHGEMRHMGNAILEEEDGELDVEAGANLKSLDGLLSTSPYLSEHSDIVALMVLEHQTQMHNALAAANYETREAIHQSQVMNKILERPDDFISESGERRINRSVDRVLEYLLMCNEFPLESPISGTSGFQEEFPQRDARMSQGRSLRQLDLNKRLFRYPCSYLIYSPAFDGLPDEVRGRVLVRLRAILEGRDDSPQYAHLSPHDRRQILEILNDTKPEFESAATATDHGAALGS